MADPRNLDSVKALKRLRETEIMQRYGATGIGIGKEGDVHVLVVYLPAGRPDIVQPVFVDGVQLRFEVTGRFTVQ